MTWLAFGLDGKQVGVLEAAWNAGYRRFDCAASYGNSPALADILQRQGGDRGTYHVLYKVDPPQVGDLGVHIAAMSRVFGGYIDQFLIHNIDSASDEQIIAAWKVMLAAKKSGLVKQIGVGNVRAPHAELLRQLAAIHPIDVVENSLVTLLADPALKKALRGSGPGAGTPDLFYYDVIKVAADIGVLSTTGIKGLAKQIDALHFDGGWEIGKQHMILSSDKLDKLKKNIADFGSGEEEDGSSYVEALVPSGEQEKIDTWITKASVVQDSEANPAIPGKFRDWLLDVVQHSDKARATVQKSNQGTQGWLEANLDALGLSREQLHAVKIPGKAGMRRIYAGMSLLSVLVALFGNKNCDWKWAIQLLQVLASSDGDWASFLCAGCPDVTF